jgi:ABC-type transport system involved in multi-copper enzyme maturation permease subunit
MVFKMQLSKVFRRPDVIVSLILAIVIPIGMAIMLTNGSGAVSFGRSTSLPIPGIGWLCGVVGFTKGLMIPHILLAIIVSSLVAGEVADGVDVLFVAKAPSRKSYVASKIAAVLAVVLAIAFLFIFSSIISWKIILPTSSDFSGSVLLSNKSSENIQSIAMVLLSLFELMFTAMVFFVISLLTRRQYLAMLACFLLLTFQKILESIESIREFVPTYIGNGSDLFALSGTDLSVRINLNSVYLIVLIVLSIVIIFFRYSRMDL